MTRKSVLGLNVAAAAASLLSLHPSSAAESAAPRRPQADPVADLNRATLASIESTWLEVPRACKARGYNVEPITIVSEPLGPEVAAIYAG